MNNCLASAYFVMVGVRVGVRVRFRFRVFRVSLTRTALTFAGTVYVRGEQTRPKGVVRKKVEQKPKSVVRKKVEQKPVVKKGTNS